jgi:hypothetical protein
MLDDMVADAEPAEEDAERFKDLASEAPVIGLVNQLIARAVETHASDVHLEPFPDRLRIRYRFDGVLHEVEPPPSRLQAAVISRIKIMARLDIAERRLPQDGRIKLTVPGHEIDFRVSTIPSVTRLDRLARSTRDLLNTLAAITGKKAGFRSLADGRADTTTAHGRLMLTVRTGGVRTRSNPLPHRRGPRTREAPWCASQSPVEAHPGTAARSDSPPRRGRGNARRDGPPLQRPPEHDFEAQKLLEEYTSWRSRAILRARLAK